MAKGLKKTPHYNTVVQKASAGKGNASAGLMALPVWDFVFDMDAVQGNEALASSVLAGFLGTFMACGGQNGLFLFTDPQDNSISYSNSSLFDVQAGSTTPMGLVGNGVTTQFQLGRNIGGVVGALDIIENVAGSITVKVNGTVTAAYSVSSTGLVTFTTAPANGASLQWTGSFRFLCRFDEDTVDAVRTFTTNSGTDLWDVNSIKFSSEIV
jgi:uncharacterized protein (TIGR02217 family)